MLDKFLGTEYPYIVQKIHEQLLAAYKRTGWTIADLLVRSGIKKDRSSLRRKLIGEQLMSCAEAERLAQVLGVTLAVIPEREAS